MRRGDERLIGTGLANPVAVLARLVDIELVVGMLNNGKPRATSFQGRNQSSEQGGLACAAPGSQTEHGDFGAWH